MARSRLASRPANAEYGPSGPAPARHGGLLGPTKNVMHSFPVLEDRFVYSRKVKERLKQTSGRGCEKRTLILEERVDFRLGICL